MTFSKVPRMIEGGIRFDHPSVRAAMEAEEWEVRIRMVSSPQDLDVWLAVARRDGYERTYNRICRGEVIT